jgi:hypothetical protein
MDVSVRVWVEKKGHMERRYMGGRVGAGVRRRNGGARQVGRICEEELEYAETACGGGGGGSASSAWWTGAPRITRRRRRAEREGAREAMAARGGGGRTQGKPWRCAKGQT